MALRATTRRHLAQSAAVVGALMLGSALILGAQGLAIAMAPALLWLAWRFDNHTGSLLMVAVLLLIALAVPALLLALMAATR